MRLRITDSPPVQRFREIAMEFCSVLDGEGADEALRCGIVWEWRFRHESHWGHHAIDALRAIHALLNVHHIEDPDAAWPPSSQP